MDDVVPEERAPERQIDHRRLLTPRRIAAVGALVLVAVTLRRQLRFAREVVRHRRRLKLAFTLLVLLRQLRRS